VPERIAYRFGEFVVEPETSQLWFAGSPKEIDPEALRLLALLVENQGRGFSSAELHSILWPSANFMDAEWSLDGAANSLREALGDSLTSPLYFSRMDGGGYQFIHPVRKGFNEPDLGMASMGATMEPGLPSLPTAVPRRWRRLMLIVVILQLAAFVVMFVVFRMLVAPAR
jgi:DNA-binding winged helix-turn-helix (wHTH) protein